MRNQPEPGTPNPRYKHSYSQKLVRIWFLIKEATPKNLLTPTPTEAAI
jgi:hypothetical protein